MAGCFTVPELREELRLLGHDDVPDHVIGSFLSNLELTGPSSNYVTQHTERSTSYGDIRNHSTNSLKLGSHGPPVPGDRDYRKSKTFSGARSKGGRDSLFFSPKFALELEEMRKTLGMMEDTNDKLSRSLSSKSLKRVMGLEDEHEQYVEKLFKEWKFICTTLQTNLNEHKDVLGRSFTSLNGSGQEDKNENLKFLSPESLREIGESSDYSTFPDGNEHKASLETRISPEGDHSDGVGSHEIIIVQDFREVEGVGIQPDFELESRELQDGKVGSVGLIQPFDHAIEVHEAGSTEILSEKPQSAVRGDYVTFDQQLDEVKIWSPFPSKTTQEAGQASQWSLDALESLSNDQFLEAFEQSLEGCDSHETMGTFVAARGQSADMKSLLSCSINEPTRSVATENLTDLSYPTLSISDTFRKHASPSSPLVDRSNLLGNIVPVVDSRMPFDENAYQCGKPDGMLTLPGTTREGSEISTHETRKDGTQLKSTLNVCESSENEHIKTLSDRLSSGQLSDDCGRSSLLPPGWNKSSSGSPPENIDQILSLSPMNSVLGDGDERRGSCTVCPPASQRKNGGKSPYGSSGSESSPKSPAIRKGSGIFTPLIIRDKKKIARAASSIIFKTSSRLSTSTDLSESRPKLRRQSDTRSSADSIRSSGRGTQSSSQDSRSSSEKSKLTLKGTDQRTRTSKEKVSPGAARRGGKIDRVTRLRVEPNQREPLLPSNK